MKQRGGPALFLDMVKLHFLCGFASASASCCSCSAMLRVVARWTATQLAAWSHVPLNVHWTMTTMTTIVSNSFTQFVSSFCSLQSWPIVLWSFAVDHSCLIKHWPLIYNQKPFKGGLWAWTIESWITILNPRPLVSNYMTSALCNHNPTPPNDRPSIIYGRKNGQPLVAHSMETCRKSAILTII